MSELKSSRCLSSTFGVGAAPSFMAIAMAVASALTVTLGMAADRQLRSPLLRRSRRLRRIRCVRTWCRRVYGAGSGCAG